MSDRDLFENVKTHQDFVKAMDGYFQRYGQEHADFYLRNFGRWIYLQEFCGKPEWELLAKYQNLNEVILSAAPPKTA